MTKHPKVRPYIKLDAVEIPAIGDAVQFLYPAPEDETRPIMRLRPADWDFLIARFGDHSAATTADADRFTRAVDALYHKIAEEERRDLFLFGPSLYRALDAFDSPALFSEIPCTGYAITFGDGSIAEVSRDYCPGVFFTWDSRPYPHLNVAPDVLADLMYLCADDERDALHANLAHLQKYGDPADHRGTAFSTLLKLVEKNWKQIKRNSKQRPELDKSLRDILKRYERPTDVAHACTRDLEAWWLVFQTIFDVSEPIFAISNVAFRIEDPDFANENLHDLPYYYGAGDDKMRAFHDFLAGLAIENDSTAGWKHATVTLLYKPVAFDDLEAYPDIKEALQPILDPEEDFDHDAVMTRLAELGVRLDDYDERLHVFEVSVDGSDPSMADIGDAIHSLHKALGGEPIHRRHELPDPFIDHETVWEWHEAGCTPTSPIGAFCGFSDPEDDHGDTGHPIQVCIPLVYPASAHGQLARLADISEKAEALVARWKVPRG
jgi:hypothetical protein